MATHSGKKRPKASSLNKAKTNPKKVKPSESVPKKTSGRFKNVKTSRKVNAKIPKVTPNPLDASEQGLNEIVKRRSTQPTSTNSANKSIATNSTKKRVLSLGKKVVKTTGGGALAPILALGAATLPVDQIGKRSDSKKSQRKQGYKRPALDNQSMEKMVDPTFGGGYVKKNAPGGLQPGSTKNLERFDNVKAFKKPVPTTPAKKPTLLKPLPEAIEVKQLKVTPLQPKPSPKISKVESGVKNSPDVFSQFMSNMLDVKVTPSTTGSDGKMVFPKHDTTGTTASNQYGGPIYGKIKRRNK